MAVATIGKSTVGQTSGPKEEDQKNMAQQDDHSLASHNNCAQGGKDSQIHFEWHTTLSCCKGHEYRALNL